MGCYIQAGDFHAAIMQLSWTDLSIVSPILKTRLFNIGIEILEFLEGRKNFEPNEMHLLNVAKWITQMIWHRVEWTPERSIAYLAERAGVIFRSLWHSNYLPKPLKTIPLSMLEEITDLEVGYLCLCSLPEIEDDANSIEELHMLPSPFINQFLVAILPLKLKLRAITFDRLNLDQDILEDFLRLTGKSVTTLIFKECTLSKSEIPFDLVPNLTTLKIEKVMLRVSHPIPKSVERLSLASVPLNIFPRFDKILKRLKFLELSDIPGMNNGQVNFSKLKNIQVLRIHSGSSILGTLKKSPICCGSLSRTIQAASLIGLQNTTDYIFDSLPTVELGVVNDSLCSFLFIRKNSFNFSLQPYSEISDKIFKAFVPKTLSKINLNHTAITDDAIQVITKHCKDVIEIQLENTRITNLAVAFMKDSYKNKLKVLNLGLTKINDNLLLDKLISQNTDSLEVLILSGLRCAGILSFNYPNRIQYLKLDKTFLSRTTMNNVRKSSIFLRSLDISVNQIVDNHTLEEISKLQYLQVLNIGECFSISDPYSLKSEILEELTAAPLTDHYGMVFTLQCPNLRMFHAQKGLM